MVLQYPLDRLQEVRTKRQIVIEHLLSLDQQGVGVGGLQETGEQGNRLRVTGARINRDDDDDDCWPIM